MCFTTGCVACSSGLTGHKRTALAQGPLRILSTNPRYFADGNGRAAYLTGSHHWWNLQDAGTSSAPPIFDFPTSFLLTSILHLLTSLLSLLLYFTLHLLLTLLTLPVYCDALQVEPRLIKYSPPIYTYSLLYNSASIPDPPPSSHSLQCAYSSDHYHLLSYLCLYTVAS